MAAAPLLSSCGGSGGTDLEFWQFYAPTTQSEPDLKAQNDWFNSVVADWNAKNPEQVRPVYIPAYTDPKNTRLATSFASGSGPDIFLISPGDFLRYYNGGALHDLTPYLEQEAIDDFAPGVLDTRSEDGRIFAIPMEVEPVAIFYSRPAWEKAGLSEGDIPQSWDQLLGVADKLATGQQAGLVFETTPGYYQNFLWYPWLWQGGGEVVDPETQQAAFTGKAVNQALELFGESVARGVSPRTLPAAGDLVGAFQQGFAGMWQSGIYDLAAFRGRAPDFDFGVFPLPQPPGGRPGTVLGGWSWCVNARGKNPEAAARFVVDSVGSMEDACIDRLTEWCSVAKTDMPPRTSVGERMEQKGAFDNEMMRTFRDDILPSGRSEPRYPPMLYKAVSNAIQNVQTAGGAPGEQAATAQQTIESFLSTYEGGTLI